ncbi:MAG: thiamine pyrophosphate-dependent enzyme [Acetobacterales bacterium]
MPVKRSLPDRRDVVRALAARRGDAAVVSSLGSPTWDLAAAGDSPLNYYLWGAMGAAAMMGLGLALAQPKRRIVALCGDGEMLMALGSLATISVLAPKNLSLLVLDNGHYLETGGQRSHTSRGTDLAAMARGAGLRTVLSCEDTPGVDKAIEAVVAGNGPVFALVRVGADTPPLVMPERDGGVLKTRMRAALS